MNMQLMQRAARLARPGMFGAAATALAVYAAASYVSRLSARLDTVLDEIDGAQREIEMLETMKASLTLECNQIGARRNELLDILHATMAQDIEGGKYDDAVKVRALSLNVAAANEIHFVPTDLEHEHVQP